MKASGFTNSP
uniref:Uncharacterized protein n=1 Tax=Anguilla anguilla TaxID=7936 RepID=A0A0E9XWC7_ANGAN